MSIEKELLAATKIKRRNDEDDQDFYQRVIDAVSDLSDDDWGSISDAAQKWVNAGVKSIEDGNPIDDFPDGEASAVEEDDEDPEQEETAVKKKGKDKTDNNKGRAKAEAKKSSKADKETEPKGKKSKIAEEPEETQVRARAAKPSKASKEPKEPKERKTREARNGACFELVSLLIKQPKITFDDVNAKLAKKDMSVKQSTYLTWGNLVRMVMRAADQLGVLK